MLTAHTFTPCHVRKPSFKNGSSRNENVKKLFFHTRHISAHSHLFIIVLQLLGISNLYSYVKI